MLWSAKKKIKNYRDKLKKLENVGDIKTKVDEEYTKADKIYDVHSQLTNDEWNESFESTKQY